MSVSDNSMPDISLDNFTNDDDLPHGTFHRLPSGSNCGESELTALHVDRTDTNDILLPEFQRLQAPASLVSAFSLSLASYKHRLGSQPGFYSAFIRQNGPLVALTYEALWKAGRPRCVPEAIDPRAIDIIGDMSDSITCEISAGWSDRSGRTGAAETYSIQT